MKSTQRFFKIIISIIICSGTFQGFSQSGKAMNNRAADMKKMKPYLEMISAGELSGALHFLASDYFEGRETGTRGQQAAANYLASSYAVMGIPALTKSSGNPLENYYQSFPFDSHGRTGFSQNVIAFIEGSDSTLKKEVIILSSHYDHLGRNNQLEGDQIFNGAADDGSGTVALLEIAESFIAAKNAGQGPKRSILFIHFSGEEIGMQGSGFYATQLAALPLDRVVADINLDGVGGIDLKNPTGASNYVYMLQNDSTSLYLADEAKTLNTAAGINLDIVKPLHPEVFNSDNKPFQYMLIPAIFFSTGLTEHYHKVTDEPGTIDYAHMAKIVKLVFALSWEAAYSASLTSNFKRNSYELTGKYFCPPCKCSKDDFPFDGPGLCTDCKMVVYPKWRKKS